MVNSLYSVLSGAFLTQSLLLGLLADPMEKCCDVLMFGMLVSRYAFASGGCACLQLHAGMVFCHLCARACV